MPPDITSLHESHQGTVRTRQQARLTVYWPGIDNDIDNVVLKCKQYQDHLPSNPREPIVSPSRPFQEVANGFCCYGGQNYLIIVDCFKDWLDIVPMGHNLPPYPSFKTIILLHCHSGLIMGHSSHQTSFKNSPTSGASATRLHHLITHKVMARLKLQ